MRKGFLLMFIFLAFVASLYAEDIIVRDKEEIAKEMASVPDHINVEMCKEGGFPNCHLAALKRAQDGKEEEALNYFKMGCLNGNRFSCHEAVKVLSESEEKELYKSACNKEFAYGCLRYGEILIDEGNISEAIEKHKSACDNTLYLACSSAAFYANEQGNLIDAEIYAKRGCDREVFQACAVLGGLERGKGNIAEAKRLYKLVCKKARKELVKATGCRTLGFLELEMDNKDKARNLLNQACDLGDNTACEFLVKTAGN